MGVAMTIHCDLSQNLFHSIHSFPLSFSFSFLPFFLLFFILFFPCVFRVNSITVRVTIAWNCDRNGFLEEQGERATARSLLHPPFSAFPLHVHHYFTRRSRSMRLRSHGGAISTETRSIFPFRHPSSETDVVARAPLFLSIDVYVDNYVCYSSSMDNIFFSFFMINRKYPPFSFWFFSFFLLVFLHIVIKKDSTMVILVNLFNMLFNWIISSKHFFFMKNIFKNNF